jgi:hypothetical protein
MLCLPFVFEEVLVSAVGRLVMSCFVWDEKKRDVFV